MLVGEILMNMIIKEWKKIKFINLKSFESIQKKTLFFKQIKNFHKKKREKTLYFFLLICYIVC